MNATDRIADEFDRLNALSPARLAKRTLAERVVRHVVATRCEIDMGGFASVYEQLLGPAELDVLITGLERIREKRLATQFRRGVDLLEADGFYGHGNWKKVSADVKKQIDAIGERVGSRLWDLDEKLSKLLDEEAATRPAR
jgi:hypothetical protein